MMSSRPSQDSCYAPKSNDDDHRVVRFRLRRDKMDGTAKWREPIQDPGLDISSVLSLSKYGRDRQEGDYMSRMFLNGLALVVTVALTATGVWLAANIHN
jgi:hypothetical protein